MYFALHLFLLYLTVKLTSSYLTINANESISVGVKLFLERNDDTLKVSMSLLANVVGHLNLIALYT